MDTVELDCKVCKKPLTGKQRSFCSSKCRSNYFNGLGSLNGQEKDCEQCGKTFVIEKKGSRRFCSKDCQKQNTYNQNKNELSTWGVESDYNFKDTHGTYACSYDEYHIDPTILALAEAVEEYGIIQHNINVKINKHFSKHKVGKFKNPTRKALNSFK
jgi:endogenous inhibitor of DNA gyrase (YacG/DUF329 family)